MKAFNQLRCCGRGPLRFRSLLLCTRVAALVFVSVARGQVVLLDNLNHNTTFPVNNIDGYGGLGIGLQTDNQSYLVYRLTLDESHSFGGDPSVVIEDNIVVGSQDSPGPNIIGGLSVVNEAGPGQRFDAVFVPNSPIILDPDTKYWIVITTNPGSFAGATIWNGFSTYTGPATFIGAESSEYVGIAPWIPTGSAPGTRLEAYTGVVPEPSEYALVFGVSLLGFALWRRSHFAR